MVFQGIFLTTTLLASLISARPSLISRDDSIDIQFCSQAYYPPVAQSGCPESQPTSGTGTCGNLTVQANICYTFDDFPDAPSELIGDVNYIDIPSGTTITGCNLYKTLNCTITPDEEWDACEVGSTDLTCRKHLAQTITSWICS